jgi:hypothetical protein
MQSEHQQIIAKPVDTPGSGHHKETYLSGVTANHRTPADIEAILSGESRR